MNITREQILESIFPNIMKSYWFFSSYFILYLCIPFLNKLVLSLKRKEYNYLLIIGFVFLILIPSLTFNQKITATIYLFYYYLVGAYIKLYFNKIGGKYRYLFVFIISFLITILLSIFIKYKSFTNLDLVENIYFFGKRCSILMMVSTISLFLFFKQLSIRYNKFINTIASYSFGIYLFHDNLFIANLFWGNIFKLDSIIHTGYYFIVAIGIAIIIYIFGSCIEFWRHLLFKIISYLLNKIRIVNKINKRFDIKFLVE